MTGPVQDWPSPSHAIKRLRRRQAATRAWVEGNESAFHEQDRADNPYDATLDLDADLLSPDTMVPDSFLANCWDDGYNWEAGAQRRADDYPYHVDCGGEVTSKSSTQHAGPSGITYCHKCGTLNPRVARHG